LCGAVNVFLLSDLLISKYPFLLELEINVFSLNFAYILWNTLDYLNLLLVLFCAVLTKSFLILILLSVLKSSLLLGLSEQTIVINIFENNNNINLLLINSLNKIHPYLFQFVMIKFIFSTFHYIIKKMFLSHILFIFKVLYWTIFLGSWWAYQEGTWGGWWDWDPSEFLSLLLLCNLVFLLHLKNETNNTLQIKFSVKTTVLLFCIYNGVLNIFFNFTNHNFGVDIKYFFNSFFFKLFFQTALISAMVFFFKKINASYFCVSNRFNTLINLFVLVILTLFSIKKIYVYNNIIINFLWLQKKIIVFCILISAIFFFKRIKNASYLFFVEEPFMLISLFFNKNAVLIAHLTVFLFVSLAAKPLFSQYDYFQIFNVLNLINTNNFFIMQNNNFCFIKDTATNNFFNKNFFSDIVNLINTSKKNYTKYENFSNVNSLHFNYVILHARVNQFLTLVFMFSLVIFKML